MLNEQFTDTHWIYHISTKNQVIPGLQLSQVNGEFRRIAATVMDNPRINLREIFFYTLDYPFVIRPLYITILIMTLEEY